MLMEELLTVVWRGDTEESVHTGHIAVVDCYGKLLHYIGNPDRMTFARSALKPVQALPLIRSGAAEQFLLGGKEIAVCCGSHNGEDMHVQTVRTMLYRLGLDESALQCGAQLPYHGESTESLLRGGGQAGAIYNNCSGKHAGMLGLALKVSSDIGMYEQSQHPVQRLIAGALSEMTDMKEEEWRTGIDGCGVPTYAMPLHKLALAYARLAKPDYFPSGGQRQAVSQIVNAMTDFPEMVGGSDVFDTELMQVMKGKVVAKAGAEGVLAMGLVNAGIGIAIKIDDGQLRAALPAAVETLHQLGVLSEEERSLLQKYWQPKLTNRRKEVVGGLEARFRLKSAETKP
jgi:L-asparaginase II